MNHWYISLSMFYPKVKTRQAILKKNYTLIECRNKAEPKEIDNMKLIYLGFGFFDCNHIQDNYKRHVRMTERM